MEPDPFQTSLFTEGGLRRRFHRVRIKKKEVTTLSFPESELMRNRKGGVRLDPKPRRKP